VEQNSVVQLRRSPGEALSGEQPGGRRSQAHERRHDESRAIADGGENLRGEKTQESIDWPVRIKSSGHERALNGSKALKTAVRSHEIEPRSIP
jgi:hypothetical protein